MALLTLLEKVLGSGRRLKNNEIVFFCLKCHHHKKKLQVNLQSGKSHCWTCNFAAHTIPQLLRKLNSPTHLIKEALKLVGEYKSFKVDKKEITNDVSLPECFKPLYMKDDNIIYQHSIKYLNSRGIGMRDILRYGIGYCDKGSYFNRIIIPSYDGDGKLNYFVARDVFPDSKFKYKNPPIGRNIIPFELFVSWQKPLVLVEGVFDAISVKRNAIPLLGKIPSKELVKKLVSEKPPMVYVALDRDAKKDAIKLSKLLMDYGIETCIIEMDGKDPSSIGFLQFWKLTENCETTKFSDLIKGRLYD